MLLYQQLSSCGAFLFVQFSYGQSMNLIVMEILHTRGRSAGDLYESHIEKVVDLSGCD